jgi:hypothetical protein
LPSLIPSLAPNVRRESAPRCQVCSSQLVVPVCYVEALRVSSWWMVRLVTDAWDGGDLSQRERPAVSLRYAGAAVWDTERPRKRLCSPHLRGHSGGLTAFLSYPSIYGSPCPHIYGSCCYTTLCTILIVRRRGARDQISGQTESARHNAEESDDAGRHGHYTGTAGMRRR